MYTQLSEQSHWRYGMRASVRGIKYLRMLYESR